MGVVAGRWILFIPVTMTTRYFTPTTRRKWTRPQSAAQPSIKSSIAFYYCYSSEADTQPVCCSPRRYPNKPVGLQCAEEQGDFWQTDKVTSERRWSELVDTTDYWQYLHRISPDLMKCSADAKGKRVDKQEDSEGPYSVLNSSSLN